MNFMRMLLAATFLACGAAAVEAQESEQRFPPRRSPNQKQEDYARSQAARRYVAPTATFRQPQFYGGRYCPPYLYQVPYGYYGGYYGRRYPVYPIYPPVYRTWPVTPYPFRIP